jgi:hypothetical protein
MFPFLQSRDHPSYLNSDSTAWRPAADSNPAHAKAYTCLSVRAVARPSARPCPAVTGGGGPGRRSGGVMPAAQRPGPAIRVSQQPGDRTLILRDPLPPSTAHGLGRRRRPRPTVTVP